VPPPRTGVPRRSRALLRAAGIVGAGLVVLGPPDPAHAENTLVESQPADGATLTQPLTQIVLVFENPVADSPVAPLTCTPRNGNTDPVRTERPVVSDDQLTVTVDIVEALPVGECRVSWSVEDLDGEPGASGTVEFAVANSPGGGGTTPGGGTTATTSTGDATSGGTDDAIGDAEDASDGPTWLGRVLSSLGLAVLFGSFVLIVTAWPEGPEYVLAVRFLRSVWLLTLAGTVLYVAALAASVTDSSFGSGLSPAAWLDLLDAGWTGRAALARLVLAVATGWVVWRPERVIDPVTQLPAMVIPTLAVATIGLSRTGGELAILGVAAGIVHALSMSVWVGSVVLLARVVLAGPGEEDLVHATRGFSRIATPAIVITVISGAIQTYRLDGGSLFSSSHGRVLLLKAVAVAVMLFVGMTARQVARSRLGRANDLSVPMADRLRRAFGTEAAVGVVVLGLSGWLMALTPPKSPAEDLVEYPVEVDVLDADTGLDVTVSITPGRVGDDNQMRVEVRQPVEGISGLEVTLVAPTGSNVNGLRQTIPLRGAGIAVSAEGDVFPLLAAGSWQLEIAATTPTGAVDISRPFDVRTADGELPGGDIGSTPTLAPVTAPPAPTTTVPETAPSG